MIHQANDRVDLLLGYVSFLSRRTALSHDGCLLPYTIQAIGKQDTYFDRDVPYPRYAKHNYPIPEKYWKIELTTAVLEMVNLLKTILIDDQFI